MVFLFYGLDPTMPEEPRVQNCNSLATNTTKNEVLATRILKLVTSWPLTSCTLCIWNSEVKGLFKRLKHKTPMDNCSTMKWQSYNCHIYQGLCCFSSISQYKYRGGPVWAIRKCKGLGLAHWSSLHFVPFQQRKDTLIALLIESRKQGPHMS